MGMVTTSVSRMASTSLARREASSPTRRCIQRAIGRRMILLKVSVRSAARARSEAFANNRMRQKAMKACAATMATRNQQEWFSSSHPLRPRRTAEALAGEGGEFLDEKDRQPPVRARAMSAGMKTLKCGRR
jgi:hypothetical protein